jgi:hypothetical protein
MLRMLSDINKIIYITRLCIYSVWTLQEQLGWLHTLYIDLYIGIDIPNRLRTKPLDKRYNFNFPIVNFLLICCNIPAYGVNKSQDIE